MHLRINGHDSSVRIETRQRAGGPQFESRWGIGILSLHNRVHKGSETPPILLSNKYQGVCPQGKAIRAWSWPLTSIQCRD